MPGVDKDCLGPGATHYGGCSCREAYVRQMEKEYAVALEIIEELARPNKLSESSGTLARRYVDLRDRANEFLAAYPHP